MAEIVSVPPNLVVAVELAGPNPVVGMAAGTVEAAGVVAIAEELAGPILAGGVR